jgi:hypothetical protein
MVSYTIEELAINRIVYYSTYLVMNAKDKLYFYNKLSYTQNKKLTFEDIENIPDEQTPRDERDERDEQTMRHHPDSVYDIHELQKLTIGKTEENDKSASTDTQISINTQYNISDIMGLSTQNDLINLLNPPAGYASRIITLDSLYQDDTINGTGKIAWDLIATRDLNNMTANGISNGTVPSGANTTEPLKNIVGIRMMPFRLLVINEIEWGFKYNYDPLFTWTVLIEELQAQAIIGPEGRRYHFMTTLGEITNSQTVSVSTANYWEMTTHNFNQGYYWFRQPITELSRITLSFGCPWYQFNIKNSKFTTAINNYTNLLAALINMTQTWNNLNQGCFGGNLTITGFTTANPTTDAALIEYVNSTTFTPSMYSSSFISISSIPYNLITFDTVSLAGVSLVPNSQMNIYTDIYRMIFPFEIIYKNDAVKIYN